MWYFQLCEVALSNTSELHSPKEMRKVCPIDRIRYKRLDNREPPAPKQVQTADKALKMMAHNAVTSPMQTHNTHQKLLKAGVSDK